MRVVRFFLHVLIACAAPLAAQSALAQTFSGFYAGATGLYEDYVATTNAADISLAEKTRDKRFAWSLTADHVGWTLGAGVERYIADKWTTRIEYVRSNFSDRAYSGPTTPLAVNASTRANSARASISYHF